MNQLHYKPTDEYRKWWDENRAKLSGHSIYTKGAVIWQAAIAAQEPKTAMTDAEIMEIYDAQIAKGGSANHIILQTVRAIERAASPNKELVAALERIANWDVPPPVQMKDGTTISYAAAYGSNGVRDYMRAMARDALTVAGVEVA